MAEQERLASGTKRPETSQPGEASLRSFAILAAQRVRSLAERADELGARVRADAETQAEREQFGGPDAEERARAVRELGGALAEFATGLRRQCDDLLQILERVKTQLDPEALASLERGRPRFSDPAGPADADTKRGEAGPSEGLRLLATQMAAAGATHAEIEARLRSEFGVANAREVIAQIFTP